MGTVSYMSPEQARGTQVDARTDIFSLGVLLYEMLSGRLPFEGTTANEIIVSIIEKRPRPLSRYTPEVPPELERIVGKSLSKKKDDRYQSLKDMLIDLKSLKRQLELEEDDRVDARPADGGVLVGHPGAHKAEVERRVQLAMVASNPYWFDVPTQEGIGDGLPIDRHVHGLPHPLVSKRSLAIELVRGCKIEAPEVPMVLHRMQHTRDDLHAFGDGIALEGPVNVRDVHFFSQERGQTRYPFWHPAEL